MNPTELVFPAAPAVAPGRALTAAEFRGLAAVPPVLVQSDYSPTY